MRCFTVLPDDRIIPGIQVHHGEKPGLVLLEGRPELLEFPPKGFEQLTPPTVEDGRVFECKLSEIRTLADLDDAQPVVSQADGPSDKALVIWRLPPSSWLEPPDNTNRTAAVARGETAGFSTIVAVFNAHDGFAAVLMMGKGESHWASVGGGGPCAFLGLGGKGKSIIWDGNALRIVPTDEE